jgi:hypothetical protein
MAKCACMKNQWGRGGEAGIHRPGQVGRKNGKGPEDRSLTPNRAEKRRMGRGIESAWRSQRGSATGAAQRGDGLRCSTVQHGYAVMRHRVERAAEWPGPTLK